jgi:hypothetical protein
MKSLDICSSSPKPVLLQQSLGIVAITLPDVTIPNLQFRLATDRGELKYMDIIPLVNNLAGNAAVVQNSPVTLSLGGVNLLEDAQLGIYSPYAQFGKDHKWKIKINANAGQTGSIVLNGSPLGATVVNDQSVQVIAMYTNAEHELFLKNYVKKFGWGEGLKRKSYVTIVPVGGAGGLNQITEVLPRNQGKELIQDISLAYYSTYEGRDMWIQPICINPGATFTFRIDSPNAVTTEFYPEITFFFDN